jgi:hypothetical protein
MYFSHTTCSQLLWQVWNKLLASSYKVDDGNELATSCSNKTNTNLFVTSCYELVVINLLTTCYVQTISDLLEQLVASLLASSTLLQDDNNLFQTCQQLRTSSANTSCWQAAVRFLGGYTDEAMTYTDSSQISVCWYTDELTDEPYIFSSANWAKLIQTNRLSHANPAIK